MADFVTAPGRWFVPAGKKTVKNILKKSEAFVEWASRHRYDTLVMPLWVFCSGRARRKINDLKKNAANFSISLEAGGRDLSFLLPRKYFLLHKDFYRMEGGKREKVHHFCPTNPGAIKIIGKEGERVFRAAKGIRVFHLWPDKGAEKAWCSCPTCRAFLPEEQNRIGVATAADVLAALNPDASITYYEKPGEGGTIPLRKNLIRMEVLPEEKDFPVKEPFSKLG